VQHLVSLGLDENNAEWCAMQGWNYYQKQISNSRDPFKDACDYAALRALERSLSFNYKPPKAKSRPRTKKPQEAFNFGG
jgi:hypothetical protein